MDFNFDAEDGKWSNNFYKWLSNGDDPSVSF